MLLASVLVLIVLIMAVIVRIAMHRRNVGDQAQQKAGVDESVDVSQTNMSEQDIDLNTPMSIPSISKDDVSWWIYKKNIKCILNHT